MESVSILGSGMTDFGRRDLSPEEMAHQAVSEALHDAGIDPETVGLVIFSNALGGRLCDQGCIRGQSWLRKAGLGTAAIINVDNSCAGGSSAVHLAVLAANSQTRPILVVGVEKMWTGDRSATLAGIEDGLPSGYRNDMHARMDSEDNPGGSILMGLNARWARQHMEERGTTVEQIAAAAVKARRHALVNPCAQVRQSIRLEEVLAAPRISGVLTRPMCSSFTDGAAALVLGPAQLAKDRSAPRIIGSMGRSGDGQLDYHDRLGVTAEVAWETFGLGPQDFDLVELHDATSAEELFALESLGFFAPGEAGPATFAGRTCITGPGLTVNPSGGLVARGHPLAATGLAQIIELATQVAGRAGSRQVSGARLGVAINTGGVIEGDAAFVGIHAVAAGC